MSRSLTQIFPQATLLPFDGQDYLIEPLKLKDIAYLEHYLETVFPHPFAERRIEYYSNPEAQTAILRECYLAARDYKFPTTSHSHLEEPKGRMIFLSVLLKEVSMERLLEIVAKTYTDQEVYNQYQNIIRIAYEYDAYKELEHLIESLTTEPDEESDEEGNDLWSVRVCEVAEKYGWTLEQISYLSITQFLLAWRGGEVVVNTTTSSGDFQTVAAEARKRRDALGLEGQNGDRNHGIRHKDEGREGYCSP